MKHLKAVLAVCAMVIAGTAIAAGGQNQETHREASPILSPGEDPCVYTLPEGINLEDCQESEAAEFSGQTVYFCSALESDDGFVIICEDDDSS